ncbi:hypothetical protein EG878_14700 [Enterococcus faecalis]|nr:hypothetical protein EG878_14700 [Enterococcus faecalis]
MIIIDFLFNTLAVTLLFLSAVTVWGLTEQEKEMDRLQAELDEQHGTGKMLVDRSGTVMAFSYPILAAGVSLLYLFG